MNRKFKQAVSLFIVSTMVISTFGCSKRSGMKNADTTASQDCVEEFLSYILDSKGGKADKMVDSRDDTFEAFFDNDEENNNSYTTVYFDRVSFEVGDSDESNYESTVEVTITLPMANNIYIYSEDYFEDYLDDCDTDDIEMEIELTRDDKKDDFMVTEESANEVLSVLTTYYSAISGTDVSQFTQLDPPSNLRNTYSNDGLLVIASTNMNFDNMINNYSSISDYQFAPIYNERYIDYLNASFASGENAPDIFTAEPGYMGSLVNSNNTIPINDLGISNDELSNMYEFTLHSAADSEGVIKGLAYMICPSTVIYNRTVAMATIGVSEPEDVAPYFSTWENFLDTCYQVSTFDEYRAIGSWEDVYRSYISDRSLGWSSNGDLYVDPVAMDFLPFAQTLVNDDLTWNAPQWGDQWIMGSSNNTVLSYWGPYWFTYTMGLYSDSNQSVSDWGVVAPPTAFEWGGTYLFVSRYCDRRADVAQILRDVTLSESNLMASITEDGACVNNVNVMRALANSSDGNQEFFSGQNPYGVYDFVASNINGSLLSVNNDDIDYVYKDIIDGYVQGDYSSIDEAEAAFVSLARGLV